MTKSRRIRYSLLFVLILALFAVAGYLTAPFWVQTVVSKGMPKEIFTDPVTLDVKKIGLNETRVQHIRLGKAVDIDSLQIRYRFKPLLKPKVSDVRLTGVHLTLKIDQNGKIGFDGITIPENSAAKNKSGSGVPFLPERVSIRKSFLFLSFPDQKVSIPFEAQGLLNEDAQIFSVHAKVELEGKILQMQADYHVEKGLKTVELQALDLDTMLLKTVAQWFSKQINFQGIVSLKKVSAHIDMEEQVMNATFSPITFLKEGRESDPGFRVEADQSRVSASWTAVQDLKEGRGFDVTIDALSGACRIKQPDRTVRIPSVTLAGKMSVDQAFKRFAAKMDIRSEQMPFLKAQLVADADLSSGTQIGAARLSVQPFEITPDKLAVFNLRPPDAIAFSAMVTASANLELKGKTTDSGFSLDVDNGRFEIPEQKLTVSGIRTKITLADLFSPKTPERQEINIKSVQVKKVKLDDGRIRFKIADKKSLLVENIRFKWCNGTVSTGSVRIPGDNDTYRVTLFCRQLDLPEVLRQIGAFNAKGSGTLDGKIPVVYRKGEIFFNKGFLSTTEGKEGRIAIDETSRLTAGIPLNTPQFSQLDLAQEALKDFNYKWVKLNLDTTGDMLAVAMELDGKPNRVLPFEYKKDFGGFVRVDAKSPGSNFQGIRLNVNLKLPFNDVMKFGNKLKSLLNQ